LGPDERPGRIGPRRPALALGLLGAALALLATGARAEEPTAPPAADSSASVAAPRPAVRVVAPRARGRLHATDLGLVINSADPYSVRVGEHYARVRGLRPEQVLRLELPLGPTLTRSEFDAFKAALVEAFGAPRGGRVQALALAWRAPYAVGCLSIGGALALGLDAIDCARSCGRSQLSPYFNSGSARPAAELGLWPSMLLAAESADAAIALVDRGFAADRSLGWRAMPPVQALFLSSDDRARNGRALLYPPAGQVRPLAVQVRREPLAAVLPPAAAASEPAVVQAVDRVLLTQVGVARLPPLAPLRFVPGALADHLTSFGGRLADPHGQSSALAWIEAGATASHGTVSEPCAHPQKFPHPQLLLLHYLQGVTAIEAYWKSVAWPAQSLFIGEPLAAPFARD
jgi:uncharacterized protein (TIGR03790 family)